MLNTRAALSRFMVVVGTIAAGVAAPASAQTLQWTERAAAYPPGYTSQAVAYDSARGVTVAFGGWYGGWIFGETSEWDGSAWTSRIVPGLSRRAGAAMAYDSVRGVTVLFGGGGEDGVTWTQRARTGPAPRAGHAMVYDSARGVTLLYGGDGHSDVLFADTWEWDGSTWTHRTPGIAPGPRAWHAMTYDSARRVTTLFGGIGGAPGGLHSRDDTWEWDGTTWTARLSFGPSPRFSHAMVYDSQRGVTLLFGGMHDFGELLADIWEWDGGAWTQRFTPRFLGGYAEHAMAYDSARGATVLFGGERPGGVLSAITWELAETSCLCDWNQSGALDSLDLFDFLRAFLSGNADFNTDGVQDSRDFFDFLECFFAGCP